MLGDAAEGKSRGILKTGGNDHVLHNAHSAGSKDEKASTHELGLGH
jgi:hypothetical protein